MNIATERPASQATTVSIGTLGSLQINNIKYNPAIMSGIQVLMLVFSAIFLGNLMSYLIEDFQSDDDLSDYVAWLFCEIFFNIFIIRSFFHWAISQKQGFRQFMKSVVLQLASDFKKYIGIQSINKSRLMSPTKSNINVVTLATSHKIHGEATLHNATLGLNAQIKSQVKEQEDVKIQQQTVLLNTVTVEFEEANDKPDQKNIKEEIKTELGMTQEMQSAVKGKGKGKGQSNFRRGKISGQKHTVWTVNDTLIQPIPLESEDKREEIKQEPRWKEEDKKITLASRQALKKWKERTKQLRVRKSVRVSLSRNHKPLGHKELGL